MSNFSDTAPVSMHDVVALGNPVELAAALLRQVVEEPVCEPGNAAIFGLPDEAAGPINEALQALEGGDLANANAWLHRTIGLAQQPMTKIASGRDQQRRYLRAVLQRARLLVAARSAMHLTMSY